MKTIKCFFTPADREEERYHYVPFEVPANVKGVRISMKVEGTGSVVDLGVFDSRGFRGYSGGARRDVWIGPELCTPGYLPGPIPSGDWFVLLGLHWIAPQGCRLEIQISFPAFDKVEGFTLAQQRENPKERIVPAKDGFRWWPGDFHTHTEHSDGALSVDELAALAASRGLSFLAVTDHNTISHHAHLQKSGNRHGLTLIAGQEVTTESGHANAFMEDEWVDFRTATQEWLEMTHKGNGLMSINHPLAGDCSWVRDIPQRLDLVELWHSSWDRKSLEPLEWCDQLSVVGIGGSDFHKIGSDGLPGSPTTWVLLEDDPIALTSDRILAAVSRGDVAINSNPYDPLIVSQGEGLVAIDAQGLDHIEPSGGSQRIVESTQSLGGEVGLHMLVDPKGLVYSLFEVADPFP